MTGFPTYDAVALHLLLFLLGVTVGQAWGRRRERAAIDRQLEQEGERVLRATSLWHQQVQRQRGPEDATEKERA